MIPVYEDDVPDLPSPDGDCKKCVDSEECFKYAWYWGCMHKAFPAPKGNGV